jgi:hypothetical protein
MPNPLRDGDIVGVVDDVDTDAEATAELLIDAGFAPYRVPIIPNLGSLLDTLSGNARAVVCDHRLAKDDEGRGVPYTGADVVAGCSERGFAAVLITTWANTDEATSIRQLRYRIPGVLKRGRASGSAVIRQALEAAQAEMQGVYSTERRSYRTVVRVADLEGGDPSLVEVIVPGWRPDEAILIPSSIILADTSLTADELPGRRFLADVNIYASDQSDLFFRHFEQLSEPPPDWMRA